MSSPLVITAIQLLDAIGCTPNDTVRYGRHLREGMQFAEINTRLRAAHYLAQIAHETGNLKWQEASEASGEALEGRSDLGNTEPGDGLRFRPRGHLGLTGRANYLAYGQWLHLGDLFVREPELIAIKPRYAALVAPWFWIEHQLNRLADKDDGGTTLMLLDEKGNGVRPGRTGLATNINTRLAEITRVISGGLTGIGARQAQFDKIKKVL